MVKTFDVYQHQALGRQAVKQGFGWPAFFFCPIWAFVKGLPLHGIALVASLVVLAAAEIAFHREGSFGGVILTRAMQWAAYVLTGVKGNEWRRRHLTDCGYVKIATVRARNPREALIHAAKLPASDSSRSSSSSEPNRTNKSAKSLATTHARAYRMPSSATKASAANPALSSTEKIE